MHQVCILRYFNSKQQTCDLIPNLKMTWRYNNLSIPPHLLSILFHDALLMKFNFKQPLLKSCPSVPVLSRLSSNNKPSNFFSGRSKSSYAPLIFIHSIHKNYILSLRRSFFYVLSEDYISSFILCTRYHSRSVAHFLVASLYFLEAKGMEGKK